MRGWKGWFLGVLGLGVAVHVALVFATPGLFRALMVRRTGWESNVAVHLERATSADRWAPFPSPDLLYSICLFDVSQRPLRITAAVPETYWSISAYTDGTNFWVANDRDIGSDTLEVVLVGPRTADAYSGEAPVVRSTRPRGFIAFRTLVTDDDQLEALDRVRRTATCTPI